MLLNLNTQKGYDIASAIRGPDNISIPIELKYALTARLRVAAGILSSGPQGGLIRDKNLTREYARTISKFLKDEPNYLHHYLTHIIFATKALNLPYLTKLALKIRNKEKLTANTIQLLANTDKY